MYPAVASIARMDIEWIKGPVAHARRDPEGMLNGGHTAKAVLMGVLRLALRVEALEAAAKD